MFPPRPSLQGVEAAQRRFAPLLAERTTERLLVAYLGDANEFVRLDTFDDADAREIRLPLRAIVAQALRLGAHAIVLAHNHPSGDPRPTPADLDGTRALATTLKPLGIRVRDHMIFGGGQWVSLRELGLL